MLTLIIGDKQFSSWSMRAGIILREKRVDFREVVVGLDWPVKFTPDGIIPITTREEYGIPKEPACGCGCQITQLLEEDPTGLLAGSIVNYLPRVPVLVDDETGVVICDVLAIADYLEENFMPPVYPTLLSDDPKVRSDIRVFSNHIHGDLLPLMSGMSYADSFRKHRKEPTQEALEQAKETVELLSALLDRKSKQGLEGCFLFGDFSLADAMFAPIAQQFSGWKFNINNKLVEEYISHLLNRESVKTYLAEARRPYELIEESVEDSPTWIARHYRYWPKINMLHDLTTNIFHVLENDVAKKMFELAYEGADFNEIVEEVQKEYDVDREIVKEDVARFFEQLSPKNARITQ